VSDLRLAVVDSNPGHGTAVFFSEIDDRFGVAKSSTSFGCGEGGKVTSAGWQVTLCDPIW